MRRSIQRSTARFERSASAEASSGPACARTAPKKPEPSFLLTILQPDTQHSGYLRPVWYVENAQKGLAADIAKWTVDFSDSASAASVQTGSGGRTHSLKSGNDASYGSRRF